MPPEDLYRLAQLGQISFSLWHEIANPLTIILLAVEQLENGITEPEAGRCVRQAGSAAARIGSLMGTLKAYAAPFGHPRSFSVRRKVLAAVRLLEPLAEQRSVSILFPSSDDADAYADPARFQHAVASVLLHGIHSGGRVVIRLRRNKESIETLFTMDAPLAPGLDLAAAEASINSCGGTLAARKTASGRASIVLSLPVRSADGRGPEQPPRAP